MIRRQFLRGSAAAFAFPAVVPGTILARPGRLAPNDRIQVGFIGLGGRARAILKDEWVPDGEVVAAADCFFPSCQQAAQLIPGGDRWKLYPSYQEMLEKEKLDAVFVETTTHARVRAMMHCLQAGCDVYGEKPLTLYVAEGRPLVQAVRKLGRVFQTGSQQRSMPINIFASELVKQGAIGKVHTVVTFNFWPAIDWFPRAEAPIPAGLNWDEWCNQTDLRPYHPELHRGWGKYIEYDGAGQSWGVTGWGTHSLDQAQAGLGTDDTGPLEVWPEEDGANCRVTMRFASGTLLKLEGPKRSYEDLGAIFIGDQGKIEIRRGSAVAEPADLLKGAPPDSPCVTAGETTPHLVNFFECMRSRQLPHADVEIGHRATTLCHLVNICRALGRKLTWDPAAEKFVGDDVANTLLSRPRRKGYELPEIA